MKTNSQHLNALKEGDEQALKAIFEEYYNYLLTIGNRYLRDQHRVEDVIQDIFYDLWKKRTQLDITVGLKPYLRGALVNKCLAIIRKENRIELVDESEKLDRSTNVVQEIMDLAELQERVDQIIANLPEKCREVFELSRVKQLSHKEISEQLNISTKTIENHMTRALKSLRSILGNKNVLWLFFYLIFK